MQHQCLRFTLYSAGVWPKIATKTIQSGFLVLACTLHLLTRSKRHISTAGMLCTISDGPKKKSSTAHFFCLIVFAHPFYNFRTFPFSFVPRRNSDLGSLSRLFSPLPTTVRAYIFIAGTVWLFLPSSTRIKLSRTIYLSRDHISE